MSETAEKRRALGRKRAFATGLLLFAAIVFVAMQFAPPTFAVRLATVAAEAALVGGLADWFAVTALFRRPLGLPIPHTALIPTRKDEIGRSLGKFVENNFLDPALVIERLRAENRALQLARWLKSERAASFVAGRVIDAIPLLLKSSNDAGIRRFVANVAQEGLRRIDIAPIADAAIRALIDSGKHMDLADGVSTLLETSLGAMRGAIVHKVSERTGRFFPAYFDRKIGAAIVKGTQSWLRHVRMPESEERTRLDRWIRRKVEEARVSPGYSQFLRDAQSAVLTNPALLHAAEAIWDEIKREIEADLAAPSPQIGAVSGRMVRRAGELLEQTPAMQEAANVALDRLVVDYIAPWRAEISDFIADVVKSWDAKTVADLIELEVGGDLQYVRVNGTVVGALIGTALFLIAAGIGSLR